MAEYINEYNTGGGGGALVVIISSVSLLGGCEYTCAAGTVSSNDFQLFDAPERCVACDDGYNLDNITCVANSYTCANGTAAADGTAGGSDGDAICAICDDGYVLENNACRQAIYTCDGGTAVMDDNPDSGTDDVELCAACDDGYYQVIEICMANEYMCEFGTKAADGTPTGDLNINNGDTFCTGCNPGYHLDSPLCNINTYTCFNGMSVPKGTPGIDGTERCDMCSPGFALVSADNTCAADSDGDNTPDSEDVDDDNDGLIEIHNLDMLHNIRHNLAGTSYDDGTGNGGDTTGALTASHLDNNCATATDGFYLCGYELTRDLDFEVATDYANGSINNDWRPTTGDPPTVTDPATATNAGWPGIGPVSGDTGGFTALFDGNDFTIRNLYSRRNDAFIGLFNLININGHIRALHLRDAALYGGNANNNIGVLVGANIRGTVSACSAHGVVSAGNGNDNIGGLAGVIRNSSAAGIANGAIIASEAAVIVQGGGGNDDIGGLVGVIELSAKIIASFASGSVDGQDNNDEVGGLVGRTISGVNRGDTLIIASYATGAVNGSGNSDNAGGLVGVLSEATSIIASYATGAVSGGGDNDDVGGLVGETGSGATITASYATGAVSGDGGTDNGGGLVGNNSATITNSYGFGTVTTDVTEDTTFEEKRPDDFEATDAVDLQIADADEATDYVGAAWNAAASNTLNAWNFTELDTPALMYADYDGTTGNLYSCDIFPATIPGTTDDLDCDATPTTLLPDQRME